MRPHTLQVYIEPLSGQRATYRDQAVGARLSRSIRGNSSTTQFEAASSVLSRFVYNVVRVHLCFTLSMLFMVWLTTAIAFLCFDTSGSHALSRPLLWHLTQNRAYPRLDAIKRWGFEEKRELNLSASRPIYKSTKRHRHV